jgi:hypothetical protein
MHIFSLPVVANSYIIFSLPVVANSYIIFTLPVVANNYIIFSLPVVANSYIFAPVSDSACNKNIKPTSGLPTRQPIRADGGKCVHATCRVSREARHRAHCLTKPHNVNLSYSRAPINNIKEI